MDCCMLVMPAKSFTQRICSRKAKWLSLTQSFTKTIHSKTLIHPDSCVYKWVSESFTADLFKIIDSFRKENDWLYLWVVHWLTVSNHSFKNISSFRKDQVTLFMSESLNHLLKQFIQKWFILEQNKCMSLLVSQWIIHTADLLKKQHWSILEQN